MKTDKITVNKTSERPEGVEIEIVQPESRLEGKVLCYLLTGHLRQIKDQLQFELPDRFSVEHRTNGTFLVTAPTEQSEFYEPARPIAVVGIQAVGQRIGIIHGQSADAGIPGSTTEAPLEGDIAGAIDAADGDGDTVLSGGD